MALLDAKEYDPRPRQRMWRLLGAIVIIAVAWFILWFFPIIPWFYRYGSQEGAINGFVQALEKKDFDGAYGVYFADPDWKQHAAKYNQYPLPQFLQDWGPSSEYGAIVSHRIACSKGTGSGVIVAVTINGQHCPVTPAADAKPAYKEQCSQTTFMWVEDKTRTLSISPLPLKCGVLR
jgi:hypothetical protein